MSKLLPLLDAASKIEEILEDKIDITPPSLIKT
jgi:hypothetical protein